jgi:predicted outer membrane protein
MPMGCSVARRIRGSGRWWGRIFVLLIVWTFASAGPLAAPAFAQDDELPKGWTITPSGPLSPADREVLVRVRLAGLWEGPAGALAKDRGGSARVKEVGGILETDHLALDIRVREVAAELASKSGEEFDKAFAEILRGAHGDIFSAVAFVRAGTRNDLVRQFAETGVNVVMKHMTLLESTGIVNYGLLTPPPAPALPRVAFQERSDAMSVVVWLILGAAIIAAGVGVLRVMRSN